MTDQEPDHDVSQPDPRKLALIEEHVDQLASTMTAQTDRIAKNTRMTTFAGFVLVIAIICYLKFLFNYFEALATPLAVADIAEGQAVQMIPRLTKGLEEALLRAAPDVAKQAGKAAVDSLPALRRGIEQQMEAAADRLVDKLDEDLAKMVEQTLKENHADIKVMLPDLQRKETAIRLGVELRKDLAAKLAAEVDPDLKQVMDILEAVEKKLSYLLTAKKLTPEEEFEKELITTWAIFISDSMHGTTAKPAPAGPKTAGAKTEG